MIFVYRLNKYHFKCMCRRTRQKKSNSTACSSPSHVSKWCLSCAYFLIPTICTIFFLFTIRKYKHSTTTITKYIKFVRTDRPLLILRRIIIKKKRKKDDHNFEHGPMRQVYLEMMNADWTHNLHVFGFSLSLSPILYLNWYRWAFDPFPLSCLLLYFFLLCHFPLSLLLLILFLVSSAGRH